MLHRQYVDVLSSKCHRILNISYFFNLKEKYESLERAVHFTFLQNEKSPPGSGIMRFNQKLTGNYEY